LLASGQMKTAELEAQFVNFTRAVLTTDHGLDDPMPLERPGGTADCPTGWRDRDLDGMMNVRGTKPFALGRYEDAPGRRPLSILPLRFRVPPTPSPACPVVARLMRPDPIVEIVTLPPHPQRSFRTPVPTFADLEITRSSQVIAGSLATNTEDFLLPLSLIVKGGKPEASSLAPNPLFVYRLAPPKRVTFAVGPSRTPAERKYDLAWTPPDLGGGLPPADVLAGYRLMGRRRNKSEVPIADLLFDTSDLPQDIARHWYRSTIKQGVLARHANDFQLKPQEVDEYEAVGLSSIEGIARVDGQPVFSPTVWVRRPILPLTVPLAHQVQAVFTPPAWWGARNRLTVDLKGFLSVPQGTPNFSRAVREHGSNVLDVFASADWSSLVLLSLQVKPELAGGLAWTTDAMIGKGRAAYHGQVRITLSNPNCVLVTHSPQGRPESNLGTAISLTAPSGDELSGVKSPPNPRVPPARVEQQYNVRVAIIYNYTTRFYKHDKSGPVFMGEEKGKVRAYLLHFQVNRKP